MKSDKPSRPRPTMRKPQRKAPKNTVIKGVSYWLILVLVYLAIVTVIYLGAKPRVYSLKVNDIAADDIVAPRSIMDREKTEARAESAMALVPKRMVRSDELTAEAQVNLQNFLGLINKKRNELYRIEDESEEPESTQTGGPNVEPEPSETARNTAYVPQRHEIATAQTSLVSQINQTFGINMELDMAGKILEASPDRYDMMIGNIRDAARNILSQANDEEMLEESIDSEIDRIYREQEYYISDQTIIRFALQNFLQPNIRYDREATENARKDAYDRVMNNPIVIHRGSRIVSQGDLITPEIMTILEELDLTDSGSIDWFSLSGIAALVMILLVALMLYIREYEPQLKAFSGKGMSLIVSLLIPLVIARYVAPNYPLSPPVYFSTVLICAYFGFRTAMVFTTALIIAIMPMTTFNPFFAVVALIGSLVAALFTRGINKQDNYAQLILATAFANFLSTVAVSLTQHDGWTDILINAASSVVSGVIAVIAAIGIMPLYEMFFNTVSPLRLIELSQPGHPLLKKLFVEAPGTSQHSMMVANLADSGADAIGADSLICRVSSYYHDVGKLENPMMFTENQDGINPHDRLSPEESTRIITRHPEDSVRIGKRYHLPQPLLQIALEHHGSTVLQYFYHKACEIAEREGKPKPDIEDYRYRTPLPSTRESGVVMLADSVEAAMKSAGVQDLEEAEKLMRNIVKIKNDQNQFVNSGLSFSDVEKILQAFLQVYAGQFHERIKYPEPAEGEEEISRA